jgi:dTDP-4-amino-4,6-dideoxygalactose transaminase
LEREKTTTWSYDVTDLGYNYRLGEPQAALGIAQLKRIDEGIKKRINAASYYTKLLNEQIPGPVVPPYQAPNRTHIFHLYTVKIQKNTAGVTRNEVFERLSANGIQSSVHYTPLNAMSFYKQFLEKKSSTFSVSDTISKQILSLPIYPTITRGAMRKVTSKIKEAFNLKPQDRS